MDQKVNDALFLAAEQGDLARATAALDMGADVNADGPDHWSPLHFAVKSGDSDSTCAVTQLLLSRGAMVDGLDSVEWTPLLLACCQGKRDNVARLLLQAGANIERTTAQSARPLMMAAQFGHVEVVDVLLSRGALVMATDRRQSTALILAARNGHAKVVSRLLQANGHLEHRDHKNQEGLTALMYASHYGHDEAVSVLLEHHADIDLQNGDGETALMMAVHAQHGGSNGKVIEVLLSHGANVNIADHDGMTAVMIAVMRSDCDTLSLLLAHRHHEVNVNASDKEGRTALGMAVYNDDDKIARLLMEHDASPFSQDTHGVSPLAMAVTAKKHDLVKTMLLQQQQQQSTTGLLQVDQVDSRGHSALMKAAFMGDLEMCKVLIDDGKADVNQRGPMGRSVLHMAVKGGHADCVRFLLLKCRAKIDQVDDDGITPLSLAACDGMLECVRVLIEDNDNDKQAIINHRDCKQRTALMWACHCGHDAIVRLLCDHEADLTIRGPDGWTAVLVAAAADQVECLQELLRVADSSRALGDTAANGDTIIHIACRHDSLATIDYLLPTAPPPADTATGDISKIINARNKHGETGLMIAARLGRLDMVKALLRCGAVDKGVACGGVTAGQMAQQAGFEQVAKALGVEESWDCFSMFWCF